MKPNIMKYRKIGLAIATLAAFATSAQAATVLFSDSFNRTGTLNGSTTDTGSLSWTSSANNTTVTANDGTTGGWNAKVAFTPVANKKYLLTLITTTTIGSALELGFADDTGTFGDYNGLQQDVSNMQTARIGSDATYNTFGSTTGGTRSHTQYTLNAGAGPGNINTLTLLLDTTGGLAASQLTWKVNGDVEGTWTGNVTGYNSVVFGRGLFGAEGGNDPTANNTLSSIQLEVIPEPSAALLGGLGMLALLRRRRA